MFSYHSLRRQIARQAARLLMSRHQDDLNLARAQAARQLHRGTLPRAALPSHGEIRQAMLRLASRIDPAQEASARGEGAALAPVGAVHGAADPYRQMVTMLLPLEDIRLNPERHPEGDALYHSLQVFELARHQVPYDEELLAAALLHEVGKAIDPRDATTAACDALARVAEPRTVWLVGALPEGRALRDGSIGARARRRLVAHPYCEDLRTLVDCDLGGRQVGMQVSEVDEAVDYLRQLGEGWD